MVTVLQYVVYASVIKKIIYHIISVPRSHFLDKKVNDFPFDISSTTQLCPDIFLPAVSSMSTPTENGFLQLYLLKILWSFSTGPDLVGERLPT